MKKKSVTPNPSFVWRIVDIDLKAKEYVLMNVATKQVRTVSREKFLELVENPDCFVGGEKL